MRALAVVPTYLEVENVGEFLRRLRAAAPEVDVLVVDDRSPDGTAALAREIGAELGRVDVFDRDGRKGLGEAYRAGLGIGLDRGYDVLVQIDADLSHDPAALPALLAAVEAGADAAIGSRYVPGGKIPHWSLHRRMLSRWGNRYASAVLGLAVRDATAGYRAYRADMLKAVDPSTTQAVGYGFQIEMAYRMAQLGARIVEVPITFTDRVYGISKMTGKVMLEELRLVTWWGVRDRVVKPLSTASRRRSGRAGG